MKPGEYLTTYNIAELIYHLHIGSIGICNVPGKSDKNPNRIYYRIFDKPFHDFTETEVFTNQEITDFKHLQQNTSNYHTLIYQKNDKYCERKLPVKK